MVEEHFTTTGLPVGHGFTEENRTNGTAYYTFDDDSGLVRFVVMDTVNENGGSNGSLDEAQFAWLQQQLTAATDRLVIVSSHHTSWTMGNDTDTNGPRILGPAVVAELLQHENVIAWVNGHTHRNVVRAHTREGGGGFWEINTASHIDWPQQSRLIEVTDNLDGTLSIFTTMLDHGAPRKPGDDLTGPMKLASLGRLLAANDWQERDDNRRGPRNARNVELLVPAPAWLARLSGGAGQPSVAASWPQAPSISRPRVSRTVVGIPLASSRRTNSRSSAGSDAVHFEPGVGLSGIRLTCTQPQSPYELQHVGEQVGPPGLVVDAAHHGVLDRDPALGRAGVVPGRLDGLGDREPGVDRHQLVAQLVVGRVQARAPA